MHRLAPAAILLAASSLVLAGCAAAADADDVAAPSSTTEASTTPTATSDETTPAVAFPTACEDLISATELGAIVGLTVYEVPWNDIEQPPDAQPGDELPGPLAREITRGATERLECMWWPDPAMGWNFPLYVMQIDGDARDKFVDELRSSADYTEGEILGYPVFGHRYENGLGSMWSSYVFVDDIWIAVATATPAETLNVAMTRIVAGLA